MMHFWNRDSNDSPIQIPFKEISFINFEFQSKELDEST